MLTILNVIGTRPEAIKMAPVICQLERNGDRVRSVVCSTGQHRHMLDPVFKLFGIRADIELNVMQPDQTLSGLTGRLFDTLDPVVREVGLDTGAGRYDDGSRDITGSVLPPHSFRTRGGRVAHARPLPAVS